MFLLLLWSCSKGLPFEIGAGAHYICHLEVICMKFGQDCVYVIMRDGKPFKHFGSKQVAVNYISACLDLDPGSSWSLVAKVVTLGD